MTSWEYEQAGAPIGGWSAVDDMVWEEYDAEEDHMVPEEGGGGGHGAESRRQKQRQQQQHQQQQQQAVLAKVSEEQQRHQSRATGQPARAGAGQDSCLIRAVKDEELAAETRDGGETVQIVLPEAPVRQQSAMSVQMEDGVQRVQSVQMEEAGRREEGSSMCGMDEGRCAEAACRYGMGEVGAVGGDAELFEGDDEEASRTTLLTYGWDSINNVDDMEKLFRQNSSSCGGVRRNSSDTAGAVTQWLTNSPQLCQVGQSPSKAKLDFDAVVQEARGGGAKSNADGGYNVPVEEAMALQQQQAAEQRRLVWEHQFQQRQLGVQHQWQAERLNQQAVQLHQEERVLRMLQERQREEEALMATRGESPYFYGVQQIDMDATSEQQPSSQALERPGLKKGAGWSGVRAPPSGSHLRAPLYSSSPTMRCPTSPPQQPPFLGANVGMQGLWQARPMPVYMTPNYMAPPPPPRMPLSANRAAALSPSQALHQQLQGLPRPPPITNHQRPPSLPPHPLYMAQPVYRQQAGSGTLGLMAPLPIMQLPMPQTNAVLRPNEKSEGTPMTPQEKIEKLKWRQQVRFAAEQRQRMHEAQVAQQLLAEDQRENGPSRINQQQQYPVKLEQSVVSSNAEGLVGVKGGEEGKEEESLLEAVLLHQLQAVMKKLNIGTRLCIRDALFRLARSARQRKAVGEARKVSMGDAAGDQMEGIEPSHLRFPGRLVETETNPIDRNIANLLFHRMPSPAPSPMLPHPPPPASIYHSLGASMQYPGPLPPAPELLRSQNYMWPRQMSQAGSTWGGPSSAASAVAEVASKLDGASNPVSEDVIPLKTPSMGPPREPGPSRMQAGQQNLVAYELQETPQMHINQSSQSGSGNSSSMHSGVTTMKPEVAAALAAKLPGYKLLGSSSATSIPQNMPSLLSLKSSAPNDVTDTKAPAGLKRADWSDGSLVTAVDDVPPDDSVAGRHLAAEAAAAQALYGEGGGSNHGGWSDNGNGSSSGGAPSGPPNRRTGSSNSRQSALMERGSAVQSSNMAKTKGIISPSPLGRESHSSATPAPPAARKKGAGGGKKEALRVVSPRNKVASAAKMYSHHPGPSKGRGAKVAALQGNLQVLLEGQ